MVRNFLLAVALLSVAISFCGCVEQEQKITLNPDGSGKVLITASFGSGGAGMLMEESEDPAEIARKSVRNILFDSKGIDVWSDVEYKVADDGKVNFTGTGYFKDFNETELKIGGFDGMAKTTLTKRSNGSISIEVKSNKDEEDDEGGESNAVKLTEKQIEQKIKEAKKTFASQKMLAAGILSGLKETLVFHLPGKIWKSTNFKKIDSSTVSVTYSGKAMMKLMEKQMNDDKWLREMIVSGRNPMNEGPEGNDLNKLLFGEKAPIKVTISGRTKPLFNYAKEVTAAKAKFDGMVAKLGFNPKTQQKMISGKKLESGKLIIGGVRMVNFSEKEYGIRPFNQEKGYTISGLMALPKNCIGVSNGKLTKALTDSGQDLLPSRPFGRKINFPRLSKDKRAVSFDLKLNSPEKKARGISTLKGFLKCTSATGTKEMDLGKMEFKDGAMSKESGFSIGKVEESKWNKGSYKIELKVDMAKGALKEAKFFDESGNRLKCGQAGTMSSNGRLMSMGFSFNKKPPAKGKIVLVVYDNLTEHEMEFELSDVDFLGKPMK